MAISAGFKQVCPSCEALVPIKDTGMIGKKVDCPKCKYRFVVEDPVKRDKQAVKDKSARKGKPDDDDAPRSKAKAAAPPVKSKVNGKAKSKDEDVEELEELEELDDDGIEDLDEADDDVEDLDEADDDVEELDEVEDKPKKKETAVKGKNGKAPAAEAKTKKAAATKTAPAKDEEEDEVEEDEEPKEKDEAEDEEEETDKKSRKKGKKADNKKMLGLGLAAVGLLVLAVAAFIMLRGKKPPNTDVDPGQQAKNQQGNQTGNEGKKEENKNPTDKNPTPTAEAVSPSGPWLTNLLPNDTEQVVHVFFKDLFDDAQSPFRRIAFDTPGALVDARLQEQLGFSVTAIDDLIRAEKYTGQPWSFTVVHFSKSINEKALVTALDLKPAKPISRQNYYQAPPNSVIEQFGRMSFGTPSILRTLASRREARPLFVRLHNPQTIIFADETPLVAFLKAEGQFKYQTEKPAPPVNPNPDPNNPNPPPAKDGQPPPTDGQPPPKDAQPAAKDGPTAQPGQPADPNQPPMPQPPALAQDAYMTIKPTLKVMLERMEAKPADSKDRVLYSFATELDAAVIDTSRTPEYRDRKLWQPRPVWDATLLLKERTSRMRWLAGGLHQKETRVFHYKNEIACRTENDAQGLHKDLMEVSPDVARVFELLLAHKVEYPKAETPATPEQPPPQPQPQPDPNQPPPAEVQTSKISLTQTKATVVFALDLVLDQVAYGRTLNLGELAACGLRAEMDLAAGRAHRHLLAKAGKVLGQQGVSDRGVPPGTYPPGAFKRPASSLRSANYPQQRISWMAGLLPYLGQETLYRRLDLDLSWKDPLNWVPSRTLVPEFLDPSYPDRARFVSYLDVGEVAATHFVGIAGVGLDAADYDPLDPNNAHKLGVLGYEKSRTLEAVQQGRGLSSAILLLQVPHDGPVGVTPWVAGGGSTLRGVPEKNSIAPFVLTTDRDGKPITHNGKRGTFALMTDGSVRFIDQSVSDEVFKAMCTVKGPAPANLEKNEWTPLLEPPKLDTKPTSSSDVKPIPKTETKPVPKAETKPPETKASTEPPKKESPAAAPKVESVPEIKGLTPATPPKDSQKGGLQSGPDGR